MHAPVLQVAAEEQHSSAEQAGLLPRAAIARSFGSAARHYDQHAGLQRRIADSLLAQLPAQLECSTVLDLGCGTGYCSQHLHSRFPHSTLLALDLALPMLQLVPKQNAGLQLLCADAAALPLQNACVALVVSNLTMQWCENTPQLFAELQRVLTPGGIALLSSFGPASLQELRSAWARVDAHTHVNSFVAAAALQQAAQQTGLHCTLQREVLIEQHASLHALSKNLKAIGAHNMNLSQAAGLTSPRQFRLAAQHFAAGAEGEAGIPVTWEIYYLLLQKAD